MWGSCVIEKMAEVDGGTEESCIFCQIAVKKKEAKIVYEDEEFIAFPDIRPAAEHHYLIIPKTHFGNPKTLEGRHLSFVQRMNDVAFKILEQKNGDTEDVRIGFHWPPFNSIQHLHLHVIFPASQVHMMSRLVYKANSWWFASMEWTLDHLAKKLSKDERPVDKDAEHKADTNDQQSNL